jgi:hypothetical protein
MPSFVPSATQLLHTHVPIPSAVPESPLPARPIDHTTTTMSTGFTTIFNDCEAPEHMFRKLAVYAFFLSPKNPCFLSLFINMTDSRTKKIWMKSHEILYGT